MIRSMAKRWILLIMSFPSLLTLAQDRPQARSMVITKRGIVATAQTLASQAGGQGLARGGSAVGAAHTADAVLSGVGPGVNQAGREPVVRILGVKKGKRTG